MAFELMAHAASGHQGSMNALKLSPDASTFVSAGSDGQARVSSISSLQQSRAATSLPALSIRAHGEPINDVCWGASGSYIVTGSDDTTVAVFDAATGARLQGPLRGHLNYVFTVDHSPVEPLVASGSYDEFARVWDVRTGECVRALPAHAEPVTCVRWSPDGRLLATGSYDGLIKIFDAPTGQCLRTLFDAEHGQPPVSHIAWSPDSSHILASTLDHTVRLWDVLEAKKVKTYAGHVNSRLCGRAGLAVGTLPGNMHSHTDVVIAGSEDNSLVVWEGDTGKVLQVLQQPVLAQAGNSSKFTSPSSKRKAAVPPVEAPLATEEVAALPVLCMDIDAMGRILLSGSVGEAGGGTIALWSEKGHTLSDSRALAEKQVAEVAARIQERAAFLTSSVLQHGASCACAACTS